MIIQLVDNNEALVDEWNKLFKDCSDVTTHYDNFFNVPTDCFVSPANSYGFLDGGIDNAIRIHYNDKNIDIQEIVHKNILSHHYGELLVGQAMYLNLNYMFGYNGVPDLIIAPTMRVPMKLPEDTINVYLCMRGILLTIKKGTDRATKFSISGLGTGIGKVPYDICAKQMKQAYDDFWLSKYKFPNSWEDAQTRHQLLYGDTIRDIQFDELNLKGNKLWEKS
jgi:O-acetyl-ADP-ribose deacetylase (regulator of RNase III)